MTIHSNLNLDRLKYLFKIFIPEYSPLTFIDNDEISNILLNFICHDKTTFYDISFEPEQIENEFIIIFVIKFLTEFYRYYYFWNKYNYKNPCLTDDYIYLNVKTSTKGYEYITEDINDDKRYGKIEIKINRSETINSMLDLLHYIYIKKKLSLKDVLKDNIEVFSNIIYYNLEYKFISSTHHITKFREANYSS